jgi:hypothetical protein
LFGLCAIITFAEERGLRYGVLPYVQYHRRQAGPCRLRYGMDSGVTPNREGLGQGVMCLMR